MSDVCTEGLLPMKSSSDNDSGFWHVFVAELSSPLIQCALAVTHNTTRVCWIIITLLEYHIHVDSLRALSFIFITYFLLSDGESPRLVKNAKVELVMEPRHPTSVGNATVISDTLF